MWAALDTLTKWAWVLAAFGGSTYSYANWCDARKDRRAVEQLPDYRPDGPRAIVARGNERRELLRFLIQWIFGFAGVLSIAAPTRGYARVGVRACLFAGEGLILWKDYKDRQDRRRVMGAPQSHLRRRTDK